MSGSETVCPCCKTDGLIVTERTERACGSRLPDLRGIPYCECPSCRVRGEIGELVAKATDRGLEETIRELHRIGELEASGRDIDTYITRKLLQADVDGHLFRCVGKLRAAPHIGNLRAGLSVANLRQLPPDTGLHIQSGAPRPFSLLSGMRYAAVPMVLYRYRFDGETSCIDAQNPKTLQREHRLRITGDVGVYLGDYRTGEVPQTLAATPNPRIAGQIYGACRAESSLLPPVIGIAGFPLPNRFSAVRRLYLLDTPDAPLPLAFALTALGGNLVYGSEHSPDVRVLSPHVPASDITAADIRMLSSSTERGKSLRSWLSEKLLAAGDRREEVANALLQAGASENIRAELVSLLGSAAPASLVETILLPTTEPDDVFSLGNGRLVKNTPVGIYTATRNRKTNEIVTKTLLCNVGLTVESRILCKNTETAVCTVTHPESDVPSVTVRIPRQHWNNPEALAEDVRAAYAEGGRTPYVSFYRVGGYSWCDLLQYLGAHCPVQSGLLALGATPEGSINLPTLVLENGKGSKQTKAGLVDPDVCAAYGAFDGLYVNPYTVTSFISFAESGVSLARTGVAAGFLHAIYCVTGSLFDPSGVRRPPAHLLFVETEAGIWDETIRTLAYLFSGSEYVPLMDYGDRQGFLRHWAALGTLPLVTRLTSSDDMATVLSTSPVSVIALADPLTAMACSGRGTCSFVLPHVETRGAPITPEELKRLRLSFLAIAAEKAGTGWLGIGPGGTVSTTTPCLSALGALTDLRDPAMTAGGLYRSVRGRYPGVGVTGARAFFGVLHRTWTARSHGDATGPRITVVPGSPEDVSRVSFTDRGEHVFVLPDHVIVSKAVVTLLNREQTFLFDAEQLSREFTENGILLDGGEEIPSDAGLDPRRVWVFPRAVWDDQVVRAAGYQTRKEKE